MHATIDAQFTVSLDPDKTLPLATLAESLTEIQLEATILEEILRSLDERLVEAYCGEKHARGNGDCRFQRAGTSTRTTNLGGGGHIGIGNMTYKNQLLFDWLDKVFAVSG